MSARPFRQWQFTAPAELIIRCHAEASAVGPGRRPPVQLLLERGKDSHNWGFQSDLMPDLVVAFRSRRKMYAQAYHQSKCGGSDARAPK